MKAIAVARHHNGGAQLVDLPAIAQTLATNGTSLRGRNPIADRHVSVKQPLAEGLRLIVSVRPGSPRPDPASEAAPRGLDSRRLALVIETIHERLAEPLSVSMLSSIAGLSRSHFSHAFRSSVGRTPHAHIVQVRIERAMKLMICTETSLSEVALSTGFSDQAHFTNKFRRATGMTPREWRRSQ
jgi:transcriptional regulator GlxA family with amidase domain